MKRRLISIDGGGLRGYAPAYKLKQMTQDFENFNPSTYFDAYAGTSTGAMIAISLATGFDLDKTIETYIKGKKNFFIKERKDKIPRTLIFPQYKLDGIKAFIDEYYDDKITLNDIYKKHQKTIMIFSTDFKYGNPVIFATPDIKGQYIVGGDYPIKEIILSAIGAPGYFPLNKMIIDGEEKLLGDGGLWANNPVGFAAKNLKLAYKKDDIYAISFGNEFHKQLLFYDEYKKFKPIKLTQDLIKVATRSSMNAADVIANDFCKMHTRITMLMDYDNPLNDLRKSFMEKVKENYILSKKEIENYLNKSK